MFLSSKMDRLLPGPAALRAGLAGVDAG